MFLVLLLPLLLCKAHFFVITPFEGTWDVENIKIHISKFFTKASLFALAGIHSKLGLVIHLEALFVSFS